MKFCYLDESGTGEELFAVMAGIVVDAYRSRITRKDWMDLLSFTITNSRETSVRNPYFLFLFR
jgi:hypothetical protein